MEAHGANAKVRTALRRGHFAEALAAMAEVEPEDLEASALRATILAKLGRGAEAERLADRVLSRPSVSPYVAARCYSVLGDLRWHPGGFGYESDYFHRCLRAAEEAGDLAALCEYQLRFLAVLADVHGPESTGSLVRQVRRNVLRCGDPQLLANLHVTLAQIEGRRGSFSHGMAHVNASRRLLSDDPNDWLLAIGYANSCVINMFQSNLPDARQDAEASLRLSQRSGCEYTRLAALTNLCHLHYQTGNISLALSMSEQLLGSMAGSPFDFAFVDSRVNALLEVGDLEQVEASIRTLDSWMSEIEGQSGWAVLGTSLSKARWLLKKGQPAEASAHLARATATADQRQDLIWGARFRLLRAEAELELGRDLEAVLLTQEAERLAVEVGNLPLRAGAERVRALLRIRSDDLASALKHLNRSLRIAHTLGDAVLLRASAEVLEAMIFKEPEFGRRGQPPQLPPLSGSAAPVLRLAGRASPVITSASTSPRDVLDAVESLLTLAESASLLGQESFELLHDLGAAEGLALVVRQPRTPARVVECAGWDHASAAERTRNAGTAILVPLGEWRGSAYELLIEPKNDIVSRLTVASIRKIIDAALQLEKYRREEKERAALWPVEDVAGDTDEVFVSSEMLDIVQTAKRVAPTTLPVLLTGETGTGKEVLARIIHRTSPRAAKPFLALNCTAVPRDMLDSQLFGYRRGAFTGAQEAFAGVIRSAAGGTLFLDEIGEMSLDVQPKLLRFLETSEIHPLGEATPVKVDVRIIAATNANLDRLVGEGRFREDLLYRLNVIHFRLPPLRERREEIPQLVEHFVRRYSDEFKKGRPQVTEETMEYLLLFAWPGNVRQLANELRRVVALLEPDGRITPAHLTAEIRTSRRTVPADERRSDEEMTVRLDQTLPAVLESIERLMVSRALERAQGRLEDAARRLGVSRKGLFLKRKRLGL